VNNATAAEITQLNTVFSSGGPGNFHLRGYSPADLGDGNPAVRSRGEAPVEDLGDEVPR